MTFRNRVLASIGATALLASTVVGVAAQKVTDDATVNVKVNAKDGGVLSVVLEEAKAFPEIQYSFDDQTIKGALRVTVTDERGTAAGWTFYISGSDFTGSDAGPGDSFPISGLSLDPGNVNHLDGNPDVDDISPSFVGTVPVSTDNGAQILDAESGSGNGKYGLLYDGTLNVPGDTLVDTYTSTLTVSSSAAP